MFLKSLFGYAPNHLNLYETALIHKSASKLDSQKNLVNNERLEYLGDAILGSVIAEFLYNRFPNQDEGFLTQMRSKLVNRAFLTELTYQIGLNNYIKSNTNNTAENSHIYGDAFEALIGALYLDKGYKRTREFIIKKLLANYVNLSEVQHTNTNFKSQLIEWSQKNKKEINFETTEHLSGDNRNPSFITVITTDGQPIGQGEGSSKKESQQNASKQALEHLKATEPGSF
ncbi:ribonuclease III [Mangrovibacterium diazotrophicum]|uniref:Ribonuclease 3 n=1 Tax=Mangrovibacterium diazotrophicum TaxID=1261403 RepID=A0A419W7R3_9BACT|nr:ribonuclease III [Mangrovibacterium diazotrophicum]RKD91517.1 ribonuclease-3 [Mangrovibacterium diazotrophicum]